MNTLTVFCSSSNPPHEFHAQAARELGEGIGRAGWSLVYGGNRVGLMGVLADSAREAGAKVIGVTTLLLADKGITDHACDELVVTADLIARHRVMQDRGDGFVALPGGLGTYDEIFQLLAAKTLKAHAKPLVLINLQDYYAPLLAMIDHGIGEHFIKPTARELYYVAPTVAAALQYLRASAI